MITFDTNLVTFDTNIFTWDGWRTLPSSTGNQGPCVDNDIDVESCLGTDQ